MNYTGFKAADILIPQKAEMEKWSVVACDQYTSQPEYWEEVEKIVGDAPSTLNITLPEVYLERENADERINSIYEKMEEYGGIMKAMPDTMIYVKRTLSGGRLRRGIVGAIDLDAYDYNKGSEALIRATEGTVLERIPPRVKVRENAALELPHVMLLIDDENKTVIEPCIEENKIYDFELMMGGGHIEGYALDKSEQQRIEAALSSLADDFKEKHSGAPMLFAVGDGNHSLATAKACYENLKKTMPADKALNHPARYALVEVVNLHDSALEFEPIHRVVFECDPEKLISDFASYYEKNSGKEPAQKFKYYHKGGEGEVTIEHPSSPLEVGTLQKFLDEYGAKTDYIHGSDVTVSLGSRDRNIGFILPPMSKNSLFKAVLTDGALPRKTFSMGEAEEKRFYLECRKIK